MGNPPLLRRTAPGEGPAAHEDDRLWLLAFAPDQVHRSPLQGPLAGGRHEGDVEAEPPYEQRCSARFDAITLLYVADVAASKGEGAFGSPGGCVRLVEEASGRQLVRFASLGGLWRAFVSGDRSYLVARTDDGSRCGVGMTVLLEDSAAESASAGDISVTSIFCAASVPNDASRSDKRIVMMLASG